MQLGWDNPYFRSLYNKNPYSDVDSVIGSVYLHDNLDMYFRLVLETYSSECLVVQDYNV